MSTSEEKYISPRRLNDFKTLLEDEYKIDKHSNQIGSLLNRGSKNLFQYDPVNVSEISYVINNDGSITVTANSPTAVRILVLGFVKNLEYGKQYTLSGITGGSYANTYGFAIATNNATGKVFLSDGHTDFVKTPEMYQFELVVRAGQSWTKTFYPMICAVEDYAISPEFVPYAPTNRELYNSIHGSFKNTTALSGITITNNSSIIISDLAIFNFSITSSNKISAGSATPVIQLNLGVLSSTSSRALICNTNTDLVIAWFNAADGRIYIKPSTEIPASTTIRMAGTIIL